MIIAPFRATASVVLPVVAKFPRIPDHATFILIKFSHDSNEVDL